LVPLKRGSEIGFTPTNYYANREELERDPSLKQRGPLDIHLHACIHIDFGLRDDLLGDHQDATAAEIDRASRAREKRSFGKRAETNAEVQRIAKLEAALHWIGLYSAVTYF